MLSTFQAQQNEAHLARVLVKLRGKPQLIAPALQATRVEFSERAFAGRPARFIIFAAHEIAG